tara:strand:+ start:1517 stop:1783 length:267 start_codon:yes stop_codon:yes gene_type:complete
MKYKEPRKKFEIYGTRTKWQNLGKEPMDLDSQYVDMLRLTTEIGRLKKLLGPQLFFEWMYYTGIISFKEYRMIRVSALNPNVIEIECD